MAPYLLHELCNQHLLLLAEKCLFWEEEKTLILSDLHLGKTGHFRKNGIAVPQTIFKEDMHRLLALVQFYKPKGIIIAGDLFHSRSNAEHDFFMRWRSAVRSTSIQLVLGNHDVLKHEWYKKAGIELHHGQLQVKDFCFAHDAANDCAVNGKYIFSGHIHPCVKIHVGARQSVSLPCFYFSKDRAVLPAFGGFTGTHPVKPQHGDAVFAIAEKKIIRVQ